MSKPEAGPGVALGVETYMSTAVSEAQTQKPIQVCKISRALMKTHNGLIARCPSERHAKTLRIKTQSYPANYSRPAPETELAPAPSSSH